LHAKCKVMSYFLELTDAIIDLVNEMSPYLLLGFLIAGLMHAFIPNGWYAKYLSGNTFRSVLNAAIFGIPLPLCSCGVIPTAMSLRREGASKGAVVSFLIATPQTGVDSIFATYSLMGLPFAIVRPIAALFTAIIGGVFVNCFTMEEGVTTTSHDGNTSILHNDDVPINHAEHEHHACCDSSPCFSEKASLTFKAKLIEALKFGFVEMMEDIGKWLVIGLLIAGLITALVPDDFFALFKDNTLMSMLLVLCISIPMYLCATGSIPIAVALMLKGLTPGAALVLLMAGPASNAASILVINKVLGRKTLALYLLAIISGAIAFGFGIDYLLPRGWFIDNLVGSPACCHEETSWFAWTCTSIMVLLLLNTLRMKLTHKSACSCGHDYSHSHNVHCHCGDSECQCTNAEDHCDKDETKHYDVKGMNCNHCRTNVEKAIASVAGVESVSVDLHDELATVVGENIDDAEVVKAVESIGFRCFPKK